MLKRYALKLMLATLLLMPAASLPQEADKTAEWKKLNARTVQLYQAGKYREALELAKQAYDYARRHLGAKHPHTLTSMNDLAFLYDAQGRYAEAEPLYKKALQLFKEVLGKKHPDTISSMNNLAALYHAQGRYGEAEPLYKETLQLCEEVLGKKHPDTIGSMNNLAALYHAQGRYGEAEPLFKQALQLREEVLGKKHPNTISSMNNLAELFSAQGRYGEAEPLYKQALQLRKEVLGKKHPDTLTSLNNLAALFYAQGRYGEAEPLCKHVLQLREEVLGKKHPSTLTSMNNLAALYKAQSRYGEAEPLYKQALQLREKVHGKKHPHTIASMNNLAALFYVQSRYGDAEPLYKQALQLRAEVLGKKHPKTLTSMNNLAALYKTQGRYDEAELLFKEVLQLSEDVLGKEHPNTLTSQSNYIACLITLNKTEQAHEHFKRMQAGLARNASRGLYTQPNEQVRRQMMFSLSKYQDAVYTFALLHRSEKTAALAADTLLQWKQAPLEEEALLARLASESSEPRVRELARRINDLRAHLAFLYNKPDKQDQAKQALERLESAERELMTQSAAYKNQSPTQSSRVNWEEVRKRLPEKSALIEYRVYQRADFKTGKFITPRMLALVVLSEKRQPVMHDLGELKTLRTSQQLLSQADDPFSRFNKTRRDEIAKETARELHARLFGKFQDILKDRKTLYIAPDDALHLLAFERLILPDGRFLIEDKELRFLQTGRDLLAKKSETEGKGLLALGGIEYNTPAAKSASAPPATLAYNLTRSGIPAGCKLKRFSTLPGSMMEMDFIEAAYSGKKQGDTRILTGAAASETFLKNNKLAPRVLHLSTHAYYLADCPATYAQERPLVMSGIALAGANLRKRDDAGDDGLLTALEVTGLNLQGTELVVLSACDTGQGVLDNSGGVYGLVRAFRVAGASGVLMTLRRVGDRSSLEFMGRFYADWLQHPEADPARALRDLKLGYIKAGVEPGVWSSFVLIGK